MFRGLALTLLLAVALTLSTAAPVLGADPTPTVSPAASPVLIDPLDPRAGEGASRAGAPLLAVVLVVGVGAAAVVATYAFVKVTGRT